MIVLAIISPARRIARQSERGASPKAT